MRSIISDIVPSSVDPVLTRVDLRVVSGEASGDVFSVFHPIDEIVPEQTPDLDISRISPYANWKAFNDSFRFELLTPPDRLVAVPDARITIDDYQRVPAERLLALPRPRLLIADDVGLGKTIEAGLAYLELAARRRARRVLIVTPASICEQWRQELNEKFGIDFDVFNRDRIDQYRRKFEIGANPWLLRPRVIVSLDLAKMDGTFPELSRSEWDLAILDEAHHVTEDDGDKTLNRRFAEWLARSSQGLLLLSATPHNGSDESFASLLRLLEEQIAPHGTGLQRGHYERHVVRRLKNDVKNADGTPRFIPRAPVNAIPVALDEKERELDEAVVQEVKTLRDRAKASKGEQRTRIEFLATILRKRAASSRRALSITLGRRRDRLEGELEAITSRRDLVRRARASEPITDAEQVQLERELISHSYQSTQTRLARETRVIVEQRDAFAALWDRALALAGHPESKVAALRAYLRHVWEEDPHENVLVFTEYQDTAELLAGAGSGELLGEFGERVLLLHGDVPNRAPILERFTRDTGLVLIATDVASEGLNLQERSRTLLHYDLPWNPNRLEQRNGRIDRYGQRRTPRIAFLYASGTYDGELLRILMGKIERQVAALGSIGDVLGALQYAKVEALLSQTPERLEPALRDASEKLDRLLEMKSPETLTSLAPVPHVPLEASKPEIAALVIAAIRQCGGSARRNTDVLEVATYPISWAVERDKHVFALPGSDRRDLPLLTRDTQVVQAAIGALRELRYDPVADPRVAAVVRRIAKPTLLATALLDVRSEDGTTEQRVGCYALDELTGEIRDGEPLLDQQDAAERMISAEEIQLAFEPWWKAAHARLIAAARDDAEQWALGLERDRLAENVKLKVALNTWYAAERAAASSDEQQLGFTLDETESPARRKRLARIDSERERQELFFTARSHVSVGTCEPIGLLLLMPETP